MNTGTSPSSHGLLLIDGDCGFCTTTAEAMRRRLPGLDAVPYQRTDVARYGLSPADCAREIQWVNPRGDVHGGAEGIARLLTTYPRPWRLLGVIALLPGVSHAARLMYRIVAANRHRLPTGTNACRL